MDPREVVPDAVVCFWNVLAMPKQADGGGARRRRDGRLDGVSTGAGKVGRGPRSGASAVDFAAIVARRCGVPIGHIAFLMICGPEDSAPAGLRRPHECGAEE